MDEQARAAYENQCVQLRADLKKWEGDWAAANGGKKPGRSDIKQNPDIAQKYKQYNKLRDILAARIPPPRQDPVPHAPPDSATHGCQQRKRTQSEAALPPQTPSKRSRPAQTPQKTRHYHAEDVPPGAQTPATAHPAVTPSADRASLTPVVTVPTSISPTPQRDGRVLGIFDLLGRTPSRSSSSTPAPPPVATPSKHAGTHAPQLLDATATPSTARLVTTPGSSKRTTTTTTATVTAHLLFPSSSRTPRKNTTTATASTPFKTPTTNRLSKTRPGAATPTSATPSFLRRRTAPTGAAAAGDGVLARVDELDEDGAGEGGEEWKKVGPLRLPRKLAGVGRGLSSVVADLRRMEEEAFGDEEEVLREMEAMEEGGGQQQASKGMGVAGTGEGRDAAEGVVPAPLGRDIPAHDKPGRHEEAETTAGGLLLSGFDDEARYDSPDEAQQQQQQQQQPLRQFKKRGQKRTTRLVNMRPTRAKRPVSVGNESESEPDSGEDETIPETQLVSSNPPAPTLRLSDDEQTDGGYSASEADYNDEDEDEKTRKKTKTTKKTAAAKEKENKTKKSKDAQGKTDGKSGEGVVTRAVRKVKATAHANFKRLKLRNSGAKGGPGYNSRFRRRR